VNSENYGRKYFKNEELCICDQDCKLSQSIIANRKEYVISKQVLKSGTAIGALIREAEFTQSKKDFVNKLSTSLKEANETAY
jgi:four helix bundle protein